MTKAIDLNSDMGEGWGAYRMGDDAAMLDIVTSANVACGFHGGDPLVMARTIDLARDRGVAIGAHPSFLDPWGFGRRQIVGEAPEDIGKHVIYQLGAIIAMARTRGHRVTHVKAHGTLYTQAAVDRPLADAIARAVAAVDPNLILMVMPGMEAEKAGEAAGLRLAREVYADRTYGDDGNLTPRKQPGAVLHDPDLAADRVLAMLADGAITTTSGRKLPVRIDTICVHGDNPAAVAMAALLRQRLVAEGYALRPFTDYVRRKDEPAAWVPANKLLEMLLAVEVDPTTSELSKRDWESYIYTRIYKLVEAADDPAEAAKEFFRYVFENGLGYGNSECTPQGVASFFIESPEITEAIYVRDGSAPNGYIVNSNSVHGLRDANFYDWFDSIGFIVPSKWD
ncbi:LamB/YcsF family protein [Zavarzinia sp. CC-PAN008]|uniref:LamB/YcsF family protein n=1 Tax=Zavarzinia sp. CC-PAN008 TaxID=3243332 RepID=UPI003F74623C